MMNLVQLRRESSRRMYCSAIRTFSLQLCVTVIIAEVSFFSLAVFKLLSISASLIVLSITNL